MNGSRPPDGSSPSAPERNPGDEARPGAPQTGDQICSTCGGTGQVAEGPCEECGGSGRVTVIVGDA